MAQPARFLPAYLEVDQLFQPLCAARAERLGEQLCRFITEENSPVGAIESKETRQHGRIVAGQQISRELFEQQFVDQVVFWRRVFVPVEAANGNRGFAVGLRLENI